MAPTMTITSMMLLTTCTETIVVFMRIVSTPQPNIVNDDQNRKEINISQDYVCSTSLEISVRSSTGCHQERLRVKKRRTQRYKDEKDPFHATIHAQPTIHPRPFPSLLCFFLPVLLVNRNQSTLEFEDKFFLGSFGLTNVNVMVSEFFKSFSQYHRSHFHRTDSGKDKGIILGMLVHVLQKEFGQLEPWQARFFVVFHMVARIERQGIGGGIDAGYR